MRLVGLRDSVVIEVWDASGESPSLKDPDDDAETGRGLHLVQQLATHWGSYGTMGAKAVWAELPVYSVEPTPLPKRRKSGRSAAGPRPVRGPDADLLRLVLAELHTLQYATDLFDIDPRATPAGASAVNGTDS
ncbi:ATP-binding protein [Streptomyces sp. NPDC058092]|uniref:ATP-binding protein n=1 Tax=Streptomyces sp. NPDC058092 TaxID=3346336 RepID=UPI0036E3760E